MSSIPNSAMRHAHAAPSVIVDEPKSLTTLDRIVNRSRTVPLGAWLVGAAALGVAAAAATVSLWERPQPKKRRRSSSTGAGARRRKASAA